VRTERRDRNSWNENILGENNWNENRSDENILDENRSDENNWIENRSDEIRSDKKAGMENDDSKGISGRHGRHKLLFGSK